MNVTNSVISGNSAVSVCCRDCIERATQIETEKDPSNKSLFCREEASIYIRNYFTMTC